MARAQSFLVNDNVRVKDTRLINAFIEPHIFLNELIRRKNSLVLSSTTVEIDARYDFRPDRLAYEQYGEDFWYPAILVVNNMGSMLQFKAATLNYKCKIPSAEIVREIIGAVNETSITVDSIVNDLFKN